MNGAGFIAVFPPFENRLYANDLACAKSTRAPGRLIPAAGEFGFALLHEGTHTLGIIRVEACLALEVAFEIELGIERVGCRGVERPLDQRQSLRRRGGEMLADAARLIDQRVIVDAAPDQSPFGGLVG